MKEEITSEIKSLLVESEGEREREREKERDVEATKTLNRGNVRNNIEEETENKTRNLYTPAKSVRINATQNAWINDAPSTNCNRISPLFPFTGFLRHSD